MSAPHIKRNNNIFYNYNNKNTNIINNEQTNIMKNNYHYKYSETNKKSNLYSTDYQYGKNQDFVYNKYLLGDTNQKNVTKNNQFSYNNDNKEYEQNYLNQNTKISNQNEWKTYEKYFNQNQNFEYSPNTYIPNNNYTKSKTNINSTEPYSNILYNEHNSSDQNKNLLNNTYGYELLNPNSNKKEEKYNEYTSSTDYTLTNNNIINNDINNNIFKTIPKDCYSLKYNYYFHKTGLHNIGSTCYMNATLQCLLHVSPLVEYFLFVYPKQYKDIDKINESNQTKGKISYAFFELIKSIDSKGKQKNSINSQYSNYYLYQTSDAFNNAVSPEIFQRTVGTYNPLFRNLEANDSKDLILYLLQIMHQELNYYTLNKPFTGYPNQCDRENTLQAFITSYDATNKSIISDLFYGTKISIFIMDLKIILVLIN